MPYLTVGRENSGEIELYYEDHGTGSPVLLCHGYPLSCRSWERQVTFLLDLGRRVITYDRRGWGNSSQPALGYDYDTLAADLNAVIERLDLRKVALVGHSMGTGDITHYLGRYGSGRVSTATLISPVPPYLVSVDDDPAGMPSATFDEFVAAARADRASWLRDILRRAYDVDRLPGTLVTEDAFEASVAIAVAGSAIAALDSITSWRNDFRADVASFDIPVQVVQGDADRVFPLEFTGARLAGLIPDLAFTVIAGGPHAITWTHASQVNNALRAFIS